MTQNNMVWNVFAKHTSRINAFILSILSSVHVVLEMLYF